MKKIILTLAILLLISIGVAQAVPHGDPVISITTPSSANDIHNGVWYPNVSVTAANGWNFTNATLEWKSNSNSTYNKTIQFISSSGSQQVGLPAACDGSLSYKSNNCSDINFTLDTRAYVWARDDDNSYTINITANFINGTPTVAGEIIAKQIFATRTFRLDNTVPAVPTSLSPSDSTAYSGKTTPSFSSTTINASKCTLYVEERGYTMSESSDSCTFSSAEFIRAGTYTWYIRASDGLNSTDSAKFTFRIKASGAILAASGEVDTGETTSINFIQWISDVIGSIITGLTSMFT